MWGLVRGNAHGWTSVGIVGPIVGGVLLVAAFVAWELRAASPMLPMHFFRSRSFALTNVASLLMFFGMFGSIFLLAQFFISEQGFSFYFRADWGNPMKLARLLSTTVTESSPLRTQVLRPRSFCARTCDSLLSGVAWQLVAFLRGTSFALWIVTTLRRDLFELLCQRLACETAGLRDQKRHPLATFLGGPGVGKSSMADKLLPLLQQHALRLEAEQEQRKHQAAEPPRRLAASSRIPLTRGPPSGKRQYVVRSWLRSEDGATSFAEGRSSRAPQLCVRVSVSLVGPAAV